MPIRGESHTAEVKKRRLNPASILKTGAAVVAVVAVGACSGGESSQPAPESTLVLPTYAPLTPETSPPVEQAPEEVLPESTTSQPTATTAELPPTTTAETAATSQPAVTSTEVAPPTTEETPVTTETLISPERLLDGVKIGDVAVKNADGTPIVDIPLFLNKNSVNYEEQLQRGAVLENWSDDFPVLGEEGEVILFGHRVTRISPDYDGDGVSDNSSELQPVFLNIDKIEPGAVMTITTDRAEITYKVFEEQPQQIIDIINPETGGRIAGADERVRSQELGQGRKLVKLVACHPPNSVDQRLIVWFEQESVKFLQ